MITILQLKSIMPNAGSRAGYDTGRKAQRLGNTPGHGFNGSYVDVKMLIEHRVALTIDKYELRPS